MRTGAPKVSSESTEEAIARGRDSVADALTYLTSVKIQNFYARVINLMDRIMVPGLGTMGVSVHRGKYIFIYDPLFAARVSFDEICATCEHEVLHLILEHIPRYIQKRKIAELEEDKKIIDMTNNLAVDLAANEMLCKAWPKIKDPKEPLGYWVIPEGFNPPLPNDMSYEDYQAMLLALFKSRSKDMAKRVEKAVCEALKGQQDAVKKALEGQGGKGQKSPGKGEPGEEGEGGGDEESENEGGGGGDGDGEGSQPSDKTGSGQGQGKGKSREKGEEKEQHSGGSGDPMDELEKNLVKMLTHASAPHLGWDQTPGDEGEVHKLMEHARQLIKETLSTYKSRGTLPGYLIELIRNMLMPPTVHWTTFLHDIVQRTRQTKKSRGMSRPSKKLAALKVYAAKAEEDDDQRFRRYAHVRQMPVFPGIKHSNKFTIVYLLDTSGSMGTQELREGLSELQHIQKSDSDVRICVIYIDTGVSKEYWVNANDELDWELTGRGGTDFEPGFKHVLEMCRKQDDAPDILVYCTDGYAPPPSTKLPIPTVWLLTPNSRVVMKEAGHITIKMKNYQLEDADDEI